MRNHQRYGLTWVVLALVLMSCELPLAKPEQTTVAPNLTQVEQFLPTRTETIRVPTSAATIAPTYLAATLTATKTAVVDLSGVILKASDFPAGFQELDAAAQAQIGLTQATIAGLFTGTFSQAKATGMSAFLNPSQTQFEIVMSLVFHPLTPTEQTSFDLELSDPAKAIASFGQGFGSKTEAIASSSQFGNASIGMTFTYTSGSLTLRGDLYIMRRDSAAILVLVMYKDGTKPVVSAAYLCPILDGRVRAGLAK